MSENIASIDDENFESLVLQSDKPVLIDFSQATTKESPRFRELFERDIDAICNYFNKQGLRLSSKTVVKDII